MADHQTFGSVVATILVIVVTMQVIFFVCLLPFDWHVRLKSINIKKHLWHLMNKPMLNNEQPPHSNVAVEEIKWISIIIKRCRPGVNWSTLWPFGRLFLHLKSRAGVRESFPKNILMSFLICDLFTFAFFFLFSTSFCPTTFFFYR